MLTIAAVAGGATAVVIAEQELSSAVLRNVVIALAVAAVLYGGKWVWKAILRQMREEITSVNQDAVDALGVTLGRKIDDLSTRNDEQHKENGERLGSLEAEVRNVVREQDEQKRRLDDGSTAMKSLLGQLDLLAGDVAALRSRTSA